MNADSALTHNNETIRIANSFCLNIALNGIQKVLKDEKYRLFTQRFKAGYTACVIYTLHTVTQALIYTDTFLDGFKYIVSQGGDTDTNCAIYGAIKGYRDTIFKELDIHMFLSDPHINFLIKRE